MGEKAQEELKLRFDRRLKLEFHGASVTSDAGLPTARELGEALALTEMAAVHLKESHLSQRAVSIGILTALGRVQPSGQV